MANPMFLVLLLAAALVVAGGVALPLRKASPRVFVALLLAMPVLTFALYRIVGTPMALDPVAVASARADAPAPTMEEAIVELEAALARDPAQPEGWRLLARAHAALGNRAQARDAFMSALEHIRDDPALLVEAAQARAEAAPANRFDDEALAMLRKALVLDPASQRAQWFIGVAQRQRGADAAAIATWEALLPALDPDTAAALLTQINEARSSAGLPARAAVDAGRGDAPKVAAPAGDATAGGVRVRVSLDPDFAARARLDGNAVVFVIARAAGGPPMPVAVERHALRDLPLDLVLDDADSLMPTAKLSALQEIEVLARISASGSANRAEGDVESAPVRLRLPAAAPVELVLGTR